MVLISFHESMEHNCLFFCVAVPCACCAACLSYIHFVTVRASQGIHCSWFTLWKCILGSSRHLHFMGCGRQTVLMFRGFGTLVIASLTPFIYGTLAVANIVISFILRNRTCPRIQSNYVSQTHTYSRVFTPITKLTRRHTYTCSSVVF